MLALSPDCFMPDGVRQRVIGAVSLLLIDGQSWQGDLRVLLRQEILPSIRHGKFRFFTNFDGLPVGFVVWAHLSAETEDRILSRVDSELHLSEWNEGSSLWIRFLHLPKVLRKDGYRLCLEELFPNDSRVRMMIQRRGEIMAVELQREVVQRLASRT